MIQVRDLPISPPENRTPMMSAPKIRIIVKHLPGTRVLAYGNRPGAPEVLAALSAGALGYVSEASPHPVLLVAIMTVAQGKRFVDPRLIDPVLQNILADLSPGPPTVLTAQLSRPFRYRYACRQIG